MRLVKIKWRHPFPVRNRLYLQVGIGGQTRTWLFLPTYNDLIHILHSLYSKVTRFLGNFSGITFSRESN